MTQQVYFVVWAASDSFVCYARDAAKFMADVRFSTFSRRYPVVRGPRRILSDMLLVPTLKLSNPVQLLILMKANDLSRLTFQLALRLHDVLSETGRKNKRLRGIVKRRRLRHNQPVLTEEIEPRKENG
jgi:hypothetical protein